MIKKRIKSNGETDYTISSSTYESLKGGARQLKKITPQTLLQILSTDQDLKVALVNTLHAKYLIAPAKVQTSRNVFIFGPDFASKYYPNQFDLIVLYCANYTCSASHTYQKELTSSIVSTLGDKVMLYEGGSLEWAYLSLQHPTDFALRKPAGDILSRKEVVEVIGKNLHRDEIGKKKFRLNKVLLDERNRPSVQLDFRMNSANNQSSSAVGLMADKVCVVTGGTSGLGLETGKRMLEQQAKFVTFTYFNNVERAQKVEKELEILFSKDKFEVLKADARTSGGNALTFSPENRKTRLSPDLVGVHCVCLNAGIFGPASFNLKHVHNITEESWDNVMNTNLKGVFFGIQEFIKQVQENKVSEATAVCIKSIYGSTGSLFSNIAYQTSKHGVMGLVRQTAITCARANEKLGIAYPVRINAVSPTFTKTNLTRPMFEENAIKGVIDKANPMFGFAEKEDVANAVMYLLSSMSGSITGSDLPVDRGVLAESIPTISDVLNLNDKDIELLACCGDTTD